MITLSHYGTIKLINRLSSEYDLPVQLWSDELLNNLKVVRQHFRN